MKATVFHDPAELPQASTTDTPQDHFVEALCPRCNHAVDAVCPVCGDHVEASGMEVPRGMLNGFSAYRRLILLVHDSRNAKFTIACLMIATGDAFADGITMTEIARRHSVTKAEVSKHCRLICDKLEIDPSRYMRNQEVADKFRLANRRPARAMTANRNSHEKAR